MNFDSLNDWTGCYPTTVDHFTDMNYLHILKETMYQNAEVGSRHNATERITITYPLEISKITTVN